jgi:hypothetical protein
LPDNQQKVGEFSIGATWVLYKEGMTGTESVPFIIIIFISINPVQSRMWKSLYKYKISSTEYNVNIVIEASKYIKQSDII